jgi:hypothetical protein
MILRAAPIPAVAALMLLVAGCTTGPGVIHHTRISTSYSIQDLSYVAGRGDGQLWTEIVGNPFGSPQPAFEAAVISYMQGSHFGPRVDFTTTPSDEAATAYRVRMIFNGPAASNGSVVCGGSPGALAPSPENGTVRLLAAFCRGSRPLTFLSAAMENASGVEDPAFRSFIRRVTSRLFPPQNPERRDGDDRCTPPC